MAKIRTIWDTWEESVCELSVPDEWRVTEYRLPDAVRLNAGRIRGLLSEALDREPVRSKVEAAASVCILVDDITRPAGWEEVLESLLDLLSERGLDSSAVRILVSLAGHSKMTECELIWKLGAGVCRRVEVLQHDPGGEFDFLEVAGKRIGLNRVYMAADLKIALGTVIPHPFAGFSGGGKAVMPGIAEAESIRRNHYLVNFGRGKVFDVQNEIRRQMDEAAEASGLNLLVNAICNERREIASLHAGPLRETFASGVDFAQRYCSMKVQERHNILILNAYPKDRELLQVSNAFNVLQTLPPRAAEAWQVVVLIARLKAGVGYHAFFGPGGTLYKRPGAVKSLGGKPMIVFAPGMRAGTFHEVFGPDYKVYDDWKCVLGEIASLGLGQHDAGFFHQASMQTANG